MASRRVLGVATRHFRFLNHPITIQSIRVLAIRPKSTPYFLLPTSSIFNRLESSNPLRHFSWTTNYSGSEDTDEEGEDDENEEVNESIYEEDGSETGPKLVAQSGKTEIEKAKEAAAIGYTVVGPLSSFEFPFKPYEPVFAVVQIGSHQFKVCNGDSIFTERLKYCEVNDKLTLHKVLMVGSRMETAIGRPLLPDATVHAVVEEHALDAKVIVFKKKRRKNYRRTKGHRQELTKLRITNIQGIDKSFIMDAAS